MSEAKIYSLFPTPLYVTKYDGDTTNLVEFFNNCEMSITNPEYGSYSKNTYILDEEICKNLHDFILLHVNKFAKDVLKYNYDEVNFSQSWISHKNPGEYHVSHTHPNSIISGVFYFDFQSGDPTIVFSDFSTFGKTNNLNLRFQDDFQNNPYSQNELNFIPEKNTLVIFPSYLAHEVPLNQTNKIRKSLSFNIMFKDSVGHEPFLNQLSFKRFV